MAESSYYYTKSHLPSLFSLPLIFIFLLVVRPSHQIRHSTNILSSSMPTKFPASTSSSSSSSPLNFRPRQAQDSKSLPPSSSASSTSKELEASAHEVPSGPNPISN
ncbi:hypothetical protein Nepgr_029744 [Nepenthes gracilis]|uniref:Uncharacterized protein n=1 Tax=Nepenthes gracilis TaxID=150966 RepID=A0AAD3Y5U7_NEPGR|nr:hypothetical protein Nepgr_029744 [Nepenthes gracilis]